MLINTFHAVSSSITYLYKYYSLLCQHLFHIVSLQCHNIRNLLVYSQAVPFSRMPSRARVSGLLASASSHQLVFLAFSKLSAGLARVRGWAGWTARVATKWLNVRFSITQLRKPFYQILLTLSKAEGEVRLGGRARRFRPDAMSASGSSFVTNGQQNYLVFLSTSRSMAYCRFGDVGDFPVINSCAASRF